MKGTIKWFKLDKGFGFIVGEDSKEYFVHHSQMPERIERLTEQDEQQVEFEPQEADRGPQATNVKFVDAKDEEDSEQKDDSESSEEASS